VGRPWQENRVPPGTKESKFFFRPCRDSPEIFDRLPSIKMLGYLRSSLRDLKDVQFHVGKKWQWKYREALTGSDAHFADWLKTELSTIVMGRARAVKAQQWSAPAFVRSVLPPEWRAPAAPIAMANSHQAGCASAPSSTACSFASSRAAIHCWRFTDGKLSKK